MSWNGMLLAMAVASADPSLSDKTPDLEEITPEDATAIQHLVRAQLAALARGDAERAFDLSSAPIRETFETPEALLTLVRDNHPALTQARQVHFDAFRITPDGLAQLVHLVDHDGRTHRAMYLVVRESDGWRIQGAILAKRRAEAA